MQYKQHPLSAAFPSMPEADIQALADDIKENGLHSPVVIYNGLVLDGWHRVRACEKAKVNVRSIEYKGKNPVAFVKSHNWHRRHMTESQKAMAQVKLSEWREPGNLSKSATVASFAPTAEQMATQADVSKRLIVDAKAVEKNGAEVLKDAVVQGEISVTKAAAVAKKPKREQAKALKEAKEKKPKLPKKPSAEKPKQADGRVKELLAQSDEDSKRIASLEALVKSLKQSDKDKEIEKLHAKYAALEGRLQQCITTQNEAKKDATYAKGMLSKIRSALKVKKDSEILEAIRNG